MALKRNRVNQQKDFDSNQLMNEEEGIQVTHEQIIDAYSNWGADAHDKERDVSAGEE